ncbi:MAG: HD-GYP domain-containing protein [Dermatophilaceae bacterium]
MAVKNGREVRVIGAAAAYQTAVVLAAALIAAFSTHVQSIAADADLVAIVALALLAVAYPSVVVGDRVQQAISSIVLLAAQAVAGPTAVALVGALVGSFQGTTWRGRVFNSAQFSLFSCLAGLTFRASGGTVHPDELADVSDVVVGLAIPILLAHVVLVLVNFVLLAGMVRVAQGVPMRLQLAALLTGVGREYLGYGVIALILVVLWVPAGLGVVAALVVLAPLLVAHWTYRQHAEELQSQQRVLGVLVAAVEAKVPHLAGHSARVAALSGHMAEHLGLGPQQVADTRMAGMLHDIGQTSLPTRLVRGLDLTDSRTSPDYADAGARMLGDLTILGGVLEPIRGHRDSLRSGAATTLPTRIVAVADRYDLLTRVGGPGGVIHAPEGARQLIMTETADDTGLVEALDHAVVRGATEEISR